MANALKFHAGAAKVASATTEFRFLNKHEIYTISPRALDGDYSNIGYKGKKEGSEGLDVGYNNLIQVVNANVNGESMAKLQCRATKCGHRATQCQPYGK